MSTALDLVRFDAGGQVTTDGPALVLGINTHLDNHGHNHISLVKVAVGEQASNAYIVVCRGHGVLIDAAADPDRLLSVLLAAGSPRIHTVLTTHGHADRWQALERSVARMGPVGRSLAHPADHAMIDVPVTEVADGDRVEVSDGVFLDAIHTPGHTPGSMCFSLDGKHLFTGHTLLASGLGEAPDAAAFGQLADSVEAKLCQRFDGGTGVHPGSGDSTVLAEAQVAVAGWRVSGWQG